MAFKIQLLWNDLPGILLWRKIIQALPRKSRVAAMGYIAIKLESLVKKSKEQLLWQSGRMITILLTNKAKGLGEYPPEGCCISIALSI